MTVVEIMEELNVKMRLFSNLLMKENYCIHHNKIGFAKSIVQDGSSTILKRERKSSKGFRIK